MTKLYLNFFFLINWLLVFPQSEICTNRLDTAGVIQIAKKNNSYWTEHWSYTPKINFDSEKCEWTVHSTKSEHSNKGDCKYTNGCTIITTVTLTIDARSKKVISKNKKEKK